MTSHGILEPMPVVLAPSVASLQPVTLPRRPRGDIDRILQHVNKNDAELLVVVADGGLGKSVLLGLAIDSLSATLPPAELPAETAPPERRLSDIRALTFLSCADVATTADLSTLQLLDEALGAAVSSRTPSLTSLLLNQSAQHGGRTALFIDTLDLILTERSTKLLGQIMRRLLAEGIPIVATCRAYDFDLFFGDIDRTLPALSRLVERHRLPYLSTFEVIDWAGAYLSQHVISTESTAFLESLESGLRGRGSLRQVCAVPLLLALTCSTFAPLGAVPEDLTVSALYRKYWDDRIANERGLRHTAGARAQEALCLALARELLGGSHDRFQVKLRRRTTDDLSTDGAANRLRSEGVLISSGIADESFFHQTFAEYAGARYLLSVAAPQELNQLLQQVGAGERNSLWPVITQLLILADQEDDVAFRQLVDNLPLRDSEAVRAILLGAIARLAPTILEDFARIIFVQEQRYIDVLLDVLADAPIQQLASALRLAVDALELAPARYLNRAAAVAGRTLTRLSSDDQTSALELVLEAIRIRSPELTHSGVGQLYDGVLKLLGASPAGVISETREVLRETYRDLGKAARAVVIRIHLEANPPMAEEELAAAGATMLAFSAPRLDLNNQTELLLRCFESARAAQSLGWQNWADLLYANLPSDWEGSQVRATARLADDNEVLVAVVSDLVGPGDHDRQRVVNTLKEVGSRQPDVLSDLLTARRLPASNIAVDAVSGVINGLVDFVDKARLGNLSEWIRPAAALAPRQISPVLARLAIDNVPALSQILQDLVSANESEALEAVIDVVLGLSPGSVIEALESTLRPLISGGRAAVRRGRLDGILALHDAARRELVEKDVERSSAAAQARSAILAIERRLIGGTHAQLDLASWLASLLSSPHTDAARRVAGLLSQRDLLSAGADWPCQPVLNACFERLGAALARGEDAQLVKGLVKLFLDSADAGELSESLALEAMGLLIRFVEARELAGSPEAVSTVRSSSSVLRAAVYRSLTDFLSVASRRCLSKANAQELVLRLLRSVDTGDIGAKAWQDLREGLCAVGERDPSFVDSLERAWPAHGKWNQLAVAEAVLRLEGRSSGGRAHRLVQRTDCADSVRRHILRLLEV